jgi:hypothetical protein
MAMVQKCISNMCRHPGMHGTFFFPWCGLVVHTPDHLWLLGLMQCITTEYVLLAKSCIIAMINFYTEQAKYPSHFKLHP